MSLIQMKLLLIAWGGGNMCLESQDIAHCRWILLIANANVQPGQTGMEALVRNVQESTKDKTLD